MENNKNLIEPAALKAIFDGYRQKIEALIAENIDALGEKTPLRDACEYALSNGGKRFRPVLVYMISTALGSQVDVSQAALAIEYLHTASLIADDLPCMDDDDERRGKPALHKVYNESIALMASYALIAAGYGCVAKACAILASSKANYAHLSGEMCTLALENVAYNSGILGATGGQFLDIFPPDSTLKTAQEVMCKKTVSLFEISFVLGWLFGGGAVEQLKSVKKASFHFGMAFQIADDIGDILQDALNGRKINMAALVGKEQAINLCHQHIAHCKALLKELYIYTIEFEAVLHDLESTLPLAPVISLFSKGEHVC